MNSLVMTTVEGEALGPPEARPPVNGVLGERVVIWGGWEGEQKECSMLHRR